MKKILLILLTGLFIFMFSCSKKEENNTKNDVKNETKKEEVKNDKNDIIPMSETDKLKEYSKGKKVVLKTNMGDITLKFFPDDAPLAVYNFVKHAENGYYNGIIFHRVIDDFMIQGGDPTGTGRAGKSVWEKPFADELTPQLTFNKKGLLAMANAGPRTNGSQFFITLAQTAWLNNKHTIFGEVESGMDVVEKIGKVQVIKPMNKPKTDVVIEKAEVVLEEN